MKNITYFKDKLKECAPKTSRPRPRGGKRKEMHISKISVHNFRSINDAEMPVGKITALVGENNAGKSSLLRALNAFFCN